MFKSRIVLSSLLAATLSVYALACSTDVQDSSATADDVQSAPTDDNGIGTSPSDPVPDSVPRAEKSRCINRSPATGDCICWSVEPCPYDPFLKACVICVGPEYKRLAPAEPSAPASDSQQLQTLTGFYVIRVTNLKPTTLDLYVVRSTGAVPAVPGTVSMVMRRVALPSEDLELAYTTLVLVADKSSPILRAGVPGTDYTAAVVRLN